MENITMRVEGKKLIIEVPNLDENLGRSASGKTIGIASTKGNQKVDYDGATIFVGVNVYKK